MRLVISPSTDPYLNLALEQILFEDTAPGAGCCMLWQNHNTVVVGKHQDARREVDMAYVRAHGVKVARRLSGGGAVYHDLGNVNFTFIAPHRGGGLDFSAFCRPVAEILGELGAEAVLTGRNDLTVEGKKCSGSAQYVKAGKVMHHGTLLYDSDLEAVGRVLQAPADKYASKGLPSVRSRVTNLRPYVRGELNTAQFLERLGRGLEARYAGRFQRPGPEELDRAARLREQVYSRWDWNFGASPPGRLWKARRVEGCGLVEVHLDLDRGRVSALAFTGDFFSLREPEELAEKLLGCPLEEEALRARLTGLEPGDYFRGLDLSGLVTLLLE